MYTQLSRKGALVTVLGALAIILVFATVELFNVQTFTTPYARYQVTCKTPIQHVGYKTYGLLCLRSAEGNTWHWDLNEDLSKLLMPPGEFDLAHEQMIVLCRNVWRVNTLLQRPITGSLKHFCRIAPPDPKRSGGLFI